MPGGRPLKFTSVKELQEKIDAYFAECDPHLEVYEDLEYRRDVDGKPMYDEEKVYVKKTRWTSPKPYGMAGLAYALGLSRQGLMEYKHKSPEYSDAIKRARNLVEVDIERRMITKELFTPGIIFNAKNNFGWKDRTEQDITSGGDKLQQAPLVVSDIKPRGQDADTEAETETSG